MSLKSIKQKLGIGGEQPSGLDNIRNKLLNVQSDSDKPQSQFEIDEDTVPFGALGITQQGQAYYGEGVHGWIRKTYGDLFDPAKRLTDPDEADFHWLG